MKKITLLFCAFFALLFTTSTSFSQEQEVIAVIQEPFVVLLDPADGSVLDNQFIDLTPLNPATPKDLLQVDDELWISDQLEDRIDRFDLDGTFLSTINTDLDNIKGMAVVDDEVWVTNAGSNNGAPGDAIIRFDFDGVNLGFYDTGGDSSFDIIDIGNNEVYISYIGPNTKIERRDYSGNILGNIVGPGVVTFIQQIEVNTTNNSVYSAVFSNNGSNTAGLYEFSIADGSILDSFMIGSLRGVAQLDDGNILVSAGSNFGIQILDPSNGSTTVVNSTESAQYFSKIITCVAPTTPTGDATQEFQGGATLEDIVVSPSNVTWFATETDAMNNESPLPNTTPLVNGETYYAVNIIDSCLSEPFAVTVTVTLGVEEFNQNSILVFPNPTQGLLTIQANTPLSQLVITNIVGQVIQEKDISNNQFVIDLRNYRSGIYFLNLTDDSGAVVTKKIIRK
ncbi:T9SS type A sorting domain-containing protein [Patiriisocius hiemis]|uniref:T9SS type A sorting domain-containing protein n=1 Tax=Patiriisocius hiemis TaxID=3075604 RepID=A0ABU2YAI4_9FLAO|nr:T9SS type A sorting domain-containing protein [Constantimarinum sp. W242]MDT0555201.1 T9SS type A sorting domain-containing protein [Constantimarinum sp. W242]